ncbi:MAG: hypothetical protein H8E29_16190 [Anaerolineales bacterium]|uniref:DUF6933 domain-containing protein n=1 Tax=Candidatus Desulfolinea nitratireducens TaxID=2841698 RepID=A0A8J6NI94_9CHLR|nr:hypothetical protein [Candidatus Desulfolinea nitratireducens]
MLQIQCTQKVFKAFGFTPEEIPERPNKTVLGVWHANLITFWDNDFLLFVNNSTLYAVPIHVPDVRSQINIGVLFKENLHNFLITDEVSERVVQAKIAELESTIFTKTTGRGILGTMNNLKQIMDFYIERKFENLGSIKMLELQKHLNRIPQRTIGWKYAVEAMRELLLNE